MSFIIKDKIKLPTTDAHSADLKRLKVTNNKGHLYISFFDEAKYHIFIYKINAENTVLSIDSVNIITPYRTGYQNLINYSYINNDSIILALNPFYNNLTLHDTSIIIVDTKGKLNGVASYKGTNVPTRNAVLTDGYDGFLGSDDTTNKYYNFLSFYGASCMVFNQQKKLLVGFAPRHTIKKTCERVNIQTQYNASFLSFDTTSPAENLYNIHFPCKALKNLYYPITIEWPHMVYNSSNCNFVFGYGHNNKVIVLDHKGDYVYKRLDSYLIDSVKPYRTFYDEFFDFQRSQFGELYYNENNAEIYRTIRVGKSFFEGDTSVIQEKYASKSVYLIQVFDKLLNLKGEGVIPAYASGVYTPFKNGILIYNKLESFREQSVVLDYYTLEPIKDNIETYKEQVRSEVMALNKPLWSGSYKKYLERVFPNNVFKEVFVFNNEITTPSAKEFWKEYFKENLDRFENDSIAIIFISSSKQRTMRDLNIKKTYKNVFIDDQFIYNDFIGPVVHCQYINLRTENFDIEICDAPHTYIISRKLDFYLKNKKTHRKNKSKFEFK